MKRNHGVITVTADPIPPLTPEERKKKKKSNKGVYYPPPFSASLPAAFGQREEKADTTCRKLTQNHVTVAMLLRAYNRKKSRLSALF